MKYARLSKEQFNLLNKEFSNYLGTLSIDKPKWSLLKKNKVKVDKILDDFSDLVWDKVISEEVYLIHYSKKQVFYFFCNLNCMELISISVKSEFNLRNKNIWKWIIKNIFSENVNIFYSKKKYLKDRKIEIFELIKMGSIIDSGETYTKIKNLIYESYICK
tara:strand:+ start:738 stop:1220 length:483 start_codon:yes stop_codon:yes gene_type:complete